MVDGITPWGSSTDDPRSDAEKAATFDPMSLYPHFLDELYPAYSPLQELNSVHRCPDGSYLLTRYDDLLKAYKGAEFSSDKTRELGPRYRTDTPLYHHHNKSRENQKTFRFLNKQDK